MKVDGAIAKGALAVLPVAAVAILGSVTTAPSIPVWYAGLSKPPGTPPNGVFGPVWTTLYVMMAIAVWRILSLPSGSDGRGTALVLFFVQLALNSVWSWAFFGARSPASALVVIALLLTAIALTIAAFGRLDRVAAWLLVPYLAWVLYASWLNLGVWWLN